MKNLSSYIIHRVGMKPRRALVAAGTIGLLMLLLAACGATRTTATGESANAIYIETTDSPETAFQKVAQLLRGAGYTMEDPDPARYSLTTDEKDIGSVSTLRLTLNVLEGGLEDSPTRIQVTGTLVNGVLGEGRVESSGRSGPAMRRAWQEMEQIAHQYPEGSIVYRRIR